MEEKTQYIWHDTKWPKFRWESQLVERNAYRWAIEAAKTVGEFEHIPEDLGVEAALDLMVEEALKTSEIEGESLNREDLRSSIRSLMGLSSRPTKDRKTRGISEVGMSVRTGFSSALTKELLWKWQQQIIGESGVKGGWRTGPVYVVSGNVMGQQKTHYEGPPADRLGDEMDSFLHWFNHSRDLKGAIRAGIAHLYFECIHPFPDGNGRVGRAIAEYALSQDLGHPVLLSLSSTIGRRRKDYYKALGQASRGDLDISAWLEFFTEIVLESQSEARDTISFVLSKARFWELYGETLSPRQQKVVQRMLREGPEGFREISASKYMTIAKCSKATATRDLARLLDVGVFSLLDGGGRSTRYRLVLPEASLTRS